MQHVNQSQRHPAPGHDESKGAIAIPQGATEFQLKELLRRFGLPIPPSVVVTDAKHAVSAAEKMGYPVVLKIVADGVGHKTDIGGVLLDLGSREQVRAGYHEIRENASLAGYAGAIRGVAVEKMIDGANVVCELILGMKRDPVFGPVVMVGFGGILTELLRDYTLFLPPASNAQILEGLETLKGYPLLCGYRGRPRADLPALAETVQGFLRLSSRLPASVAALEINPLAVLREGEGTVILDALLTSGSSGQNSMASVN